MRHVLTAVLALAAAAPAAAMTEKEAATNLMYFAFAMKEGELCEKLGLPGMGLLKPWEKKHADTLVGSLRRVEQYAMANQKVTRDQAVDVALGILIRFKDTFDREMAPSLGLKTCMRFGDQLRYYESRLVAP